MWVLKTPESKNHFKNSERIFENRVTLLPREAVWAKNMACFLFSPVLIWVIYVGKG